MANRSAEEVLRGPGRGMRRGSNADSFIRGKGQSQMLAVDMLHTLGLPDDLIEDVKGMLSTSAESLEESRPQSPSSGVFGGSASGGELGHHAALARQHVAQAVLQMAAGLRGFKTELGAHQGRMGETDISNGVDLKRIEESAVCVSAPTFGTNNSCAAPTAESDGGDR